MIPEKTGAVVWLQEHGCFVRGDSYRLGDFLLVQVNNRSRTHGKPPVINYRVNNLLKWFNENSAYGTIIADRFEYFGYDGVLP